MMYSLASGPKVSYRETGNRDWDNSANSVWRFWLASGIHIIVTAIHFTRYLPFRPVLRTQAHAVLLRRNTHSLVQLRDAGTEILPPLGRLGVRHPDILLLPRLRLGIPRAPAEAALVRAQLDDRLE